MTIDTLTELDTFYLDCDNDGSKATIDDEIIKLDPSTARGHGSTMSQFGELYFKMQSLYDMSLITKPRKVAVLIDRIIREPYKWKKTNEWTALQSIKWLIQNLQTPSCGIILTMYFYDDNSIERVQQSWHAGMIWPLREKFQWVGGGNYITFCDIEPALLERKKGMVLEENIQYKNAISKIHEYSKWPIKYVNYQMGEQEMVDRLKYAKFHVCFHGASYYTAAMTNTPALVYGDPKRGIGSGDWRLNGKSYSKAIRKTSWNQGASNILSKVGHYDFERKVVVRKPQQYCIHAESASEIIEYLNGEFDMEINGRIISLK